VTDGPVCDTMVQDLQEKFRFSKEISITVTKLAVHGNDMMSIEPRQGNQLDLIICLSQCDKKKISGLISTFEAPFVNVLSVCTSHRLRAIAEAMTQLIQGISID
jgi:hypothetical protein